MRKWYAQKILYHMSTTAMLDPVYIDNKSVFIS